jgi:hypothetical protein
MNKKTGVFHFEQNLTISSVIETLDKLKKIAKIIEEADNRLLGCYNYIDNPNGFDYYKERMRDKIKSYKILIPRLEKYFQRQLFEIVDTHIISTDDYMKSIVLNEFTQDELFSRIDLNKYL